MAISPHPTAVVKQYSSLTLNCSSHVGYGRNMVWDWKLNGKSFAVLQPIRNGTCSPFGEMSNQSYYSYSCTPYFTTLTLWKVGKERHNATWSCSFSRGSVLYDSDDTIVYVQGKLALSNHIERITLQALLPSYKHSAL